MAIVCRGLYLYFFRKLSPNTVEKPSGEACHSKPGLFRQYHAEALINDVKPLLIDTGTSVTISQKLATRSA